jgi:retron-type reverse transcriptase
VKNNAAGGKDPWGDRADEAGKCEGVAGVTGPNDPGGVKPRKKVRELRRRLWAAAKRAPGRRFHALNDHLGRSDVLGEAWRRVRKNRGAAGVDGQSIRSSSTGSSASWRSWALQHQLRRHLYYSIPHRRYP